MVSPIPNSLKKLWDEFNIRGFIILSLSLQTFLIFWAPLRKRTSNRLVILLIWSAYLLADWVANFGIGLISTTKGDCSPGTHDVNGDLLAFWAPFLLLHLGGPDTIISFALEDNALWLRHLLGLGLQVAATLYVFLQSLPQNKLWLPTVLLFVAGIIKYVERTRALYLASVDGLKASLLREPDPGPDYARLMDNYSSMIGNELPAFVEQIEDPKPTIKYKVGKGEMENDVLTLCHAHHFFEIFKGLLIGVVLRSDQRHESRVIFHERNPEEAYKIILAELNFIYEAFYTKVVMVHSELGFFLRAASFSTVLSALVLFYKLDEKEKDSFHEMDVKITYTLLFGAIALDSIAVFKLLFSDWTFIALNNSRQNSRITAILGKYLALKRPRWYSSKTANPFLEWSRQILFRRWSESVPAYNLIDCWLKEHLKLAPGVISCCRIFFGNIIDLIGLKDMKFTSSKPLNKELWEFIFTQVKLRCILADDPETSKKIYTARGDWVLQDSDWNDVIDCSNLLSYIVDFDYRQSLLLWHIATELCYNIDKSKAGHDDGPRGYSKTLSDYMVYLLVMQPTMMSSVAGIGQMEIEDTHAEFTRFFSTGELGSGVEREQAFVRILEVNTDVKPAVVKGGRSKSLLFDACSLAKELMILKEKKWDLMSQVWVELLSYASSHCRANSHAELLSRGGELSTFVWLLMAHFGIAEEYREDDKEARLSGGKAAKLIVD